MIEGNIPIWYAATPEGQQGPMTGDALRNAYLGGLLPQNTRVWREGMTHWEHAAHLLQPLPPPLPDFEPPETAPRPFEKPTPTLVIIALFSLIGLGSNLWMLPDLWTGRIPDGPGGELYRALPEFMTLTRFAVPMNILTSLCLLVLSVMALRDHPTSRFSLAYAVPAVALLGIVQATVSWVYLTHTDNWQFIPPAAQNNLLTFAALTAIGTLAIWGVVMWRLMRAGFHIPDGYHEP